MNRKLILCLVLVLNGHCRAAIIFPKAPDGGRLIACESVAQLLQATPGFLGGVRIEELSIAHPHRTYNVESLDAPSGKLLAAAKPASGRWRYLVVQGTNAVGVIELKADEKAKHGLKFTAFYPGWGPKILEAMRIANQLPQVNKQDYELRFLNLAPSLFFAVWLHGEADDIIIPLPETFGRYNAYRPYSESEIIKLLKPEAKKMLKAPRNLN